MLQLAVPISGKDVDTVRARVARAERAGADLIELRLDTCAARGIDPEALLGEIARWPLPVLVTNRAREEGGDWDGAERRRLELLCAADDAGAAALDVELAALERLPRRPRSARLVLSHHDFAGPGGDLPDVVRRMYAAGADIAKVAVTPRDAVDLEELARLAARWGSDGSERTAGKGLVAIGMGEIGLPSRLLAGAWGCALAFGRLDGVAGSAPGQPSLRDLVKRYRVRQQGPETCIFGVLGDPVAHSLSPVIHNSAFAHDGLDAVYVPFLAHDPVAFWRACGDWIDGLSVTIPHKEALLDELDEVEELALRIGAVNTIYRGEEGQTIGANTDAPAAVDCVVDAVGDLHDRTVLILGAGGVARAIAFALHAAGARIVIANRTRARAEDLAAAVGPGCRALDLEEAREVPYHVIVNGTSVGMREDLSPWPAEAHRPDATAFDTVYTPLETRFLREAQDAGCRPICGLSMFIGQAAGQYQRWTGREAPEPLMQRVALEALGTNWTDVLCSYRGGELGEPRRASGIS